MTQVPERLLALLAKPSAALDWLAFPAVSGLVWLAEYAVGFLAVLRPLAAAVIGDDVAALLLHPTAFAALVGFVGLVLKLAHSSYWKWQENDWRDRAKRSEAVMLRQLKRVPGADVEAHDHLRRFHGGRQ